MLINEIIDDNLLDMLGGKRLRQYLSTTGWERVNEIDAPYSLFRRNDSQSAELMVPEDRSYADFRARLWDVIRGIAEFEERPASTVLNDLLLPPSDVIRYQRQGQDARNGTMPFEDGIEFLTNCENALRSVARSTESPKPYFPSLSTTDTERFIEGCRLGQTERGSYVVSVVCPINALPSEPEDSQTTMFPEYVDRTFTRRATTTLMRSAENIVQNINDGSIERIITPQRGDIVVSGNLCESLAKMLLPSSIDAVSIQTRWACEAAKPSGIAETVEFQQWHRPVLEDISEKLRPEQTPLRSPFIGRVSKLRGEANDQGLMEGDVVISFEHGGKVENARMDLNPGQYRKALQAHGNNGYVRVEGDLQERERVHLIEPVRSFRVVTSDGVSPLFED